MFEHGAWFFVDYLNRSFAAGVIVLAVVILRYVLKKAPKRLWPSLWGLAALRLVLPWSIPSRLSVWNLFSSAAGINEAGGVNYFRYNGHAEKPMVEFLTPAVINSGTTGKSLSVHLSDIYLPIAIKFWLIIAIAILLFAAVGYFTLRRRVAASIKVADNLYVCDDIQKPFILGILRPRIYLPSGMEDETKSCVIAHEQAHLRRGDHLWKPLGFFLAAVSWFNPLIWLGYLLLCRDLESACDEAVVERMDAAGRTAYSQALLSCATGHKIITVCPLAFGEIGVKERVKNVLHYKKPGFWMISVAVVACIVVTVCFLTSPEKVAPIATEDTPASTESENTVEAVFPENYYEEWISAGFAPWYMQNNTILIVDGDGNCTIEQGGPLTAADVEGRSDINLIDLNFSTVREKWRLEPNTKIEYDLHGFLSNIYYEVPGTPGMYQLEPPQ